MGATCQICKNEPSSDNQIEVDFQFVNAKSQQYFAEYDEPEPQYVASKREVDAEYTLTSTITQEKTIAPKILIPEHLFRSLTDRECENLNIGYLLSYGDNSMVNLTEVIEGTVFCPSAVFELPSGDFYKGEFDIECRPHGRGIILRTDNSKYIGYFFQGKIQGLGKMLSADRVVYEGNFVTQDGGETTFGGESSVLHGKCKEIWPHGIKYKGDFQMGLKHGKGKLVMEVSKYHGEFENNEICGVGIMKWKDGKKYKGQWKDGLMHGEGTFTWPDGKIYTGNYEFGEKSGLGTMKWPNNRKYHGQWKGGKQNGVGKYTYFNDKKGKFIARSSHWEDGARLRWLSPSASSQVDLTN